MPALLCLIAALILVLAPTAARADRAEALDWLERAIADEARVQAEFLEVAFNGHSGNLPVADGGERPYYEAVPIKYEQMPSEARRDDWIAALEDAMAASSLHVLEIEMDGGTVRFAVPFDRGLRLSGLPVAVIARLVDVAESERRGLETDALVATEAGPVAMTGVHRLDGRLVLRMGSGSSGRHPEGAAPDSEELSRRFGIGPLVDGDAQWSPHERASLAVALAELPAPDLAVIAGLPFRRYVNPPPERSDSAAYYRQSGAERTVNLFDATFEHDGHLFVGDPEAPFDYSVSIVLHEIGHAVAMEKPYLAIHGFVARLESLELLYRHLAEFSVSGIRSERDRLIAVRDQLRDMQRPLGRFRQAATGGTLHASPVHSEFVAATGGYGPTPYGKTKLSEAFAESYKLFLLDPRALARIDPAALAFFQSGAYQLEPLHVEPVPEVPQSVRDYLAIPEDEALLDELDALLEGEIGPLE
jgi:hypothetical protein